MAPPSDLQEKLDRSLDDNMNAGGVLVDAGQRKRAREGETGVQCGKRCYVGNLTYRTTWQELKDHFRQAGTVIYTKVMESDDGRSKGCGIVEFETTKEALGAIDTLHDSELNGRPLQVREDRDDRDVKGGGRGHPALAKRLRPDRSPGRPSSSGGFVETRRCYVGNLSYKTTWQTLKDHFRQAGNVVYSGIMEEAPGRSKGCGIIEYETPREAKRAVRELHDSIIDGRPVLVREDREDKEVMGAGKGGGKVNHFDARPPIRAPQHSSRPPSEGTESRRCYVGNLSYRTSWQDLKDYFRQAGNVVYSNVMKGQDGSKGSKGSKGCGIVEFETVKEAQRAIRDLHDSELNGRLIFVREDREDKEIVGGKGMGKR